MHYVLDSSTLDIEQKGRIRGPKRSFNQVVEILASQKSSENDWQTVFPNNK